MKKVFSEYLRKQQFQLRSISAKPKPNLGLVVVIPVHNEPNILPTLEALAACHAPNCSIEVLLMINASEIVEKSILEQNEAALANFEQFKANYYGNIDFYAIVNNQLPKKHAGVGLARKIGMDEAINRFSMIENECGVIVCFDADCTCEPNYLTEIENHFDKNPSHSACSIHFEHPLKGEEFQPNIYEYITDYELHLRVYKNAMNWCGLPYALHTVGSSMAVKAIDYCKQGGMNRRKAGEDFYFLQKFIQLGNVGELTTTTVFPSPRVSDRVPFGTGRAIGERMSSNNSELHSYSILSFEVISQVVKKIPELYANTDLVTTLPHAILDFYTISKLREVIDAAKRESTNYLNFEKRFYRFFDAFQVLKLVHYLRDHHFSNEPIQKVAKDLLIKLNNSSISESNLELLHTFRMIDLKVELI
tara:strand:+ start:2670 stop:3926 length:1257 start_codon:yes stop_codon:yes gene_type:complete